MSRRCPACGRRYPADLRFCEEDGTMLIEGQFPLLALVSLISGLLLAILIGFGIWFAASRYQYRVSLAAVPISLRRDVPGPTISCRSPRQSAVCGGTALLSHTAGDN